MRKRIIFAVVLIGMFLSFAMPTTAAPYGVFVPNSAFDRLNNGTAITSKQNNLSTVWAWDGGGGVETTIHAFVGPVQSIYTYLPETIQAGDTWTLNATSFAGWPSTADDLEARLFWHDGGGARTTIASFARTNPGSMDVSLTANEGDAFIGKNIGIEFYSPMTGSNWTQVDNLSLTVDPGALQYMPIPIANSSFEDGQTSWGFSGGGVTANDGESDGILAAWFGSGSGAWQGIGKEIVNGETYRLLFETHQTGGSGTPELTVDLFAYEEGDDLSDQANRTAIETLFLPGLSSTLQTVELTYEGDLISDGMLLGIDFSNSGSGWLGVDNLRLSSVAATAVPEPSTFVV